MADERDMPVQQWEYRLLHLEHQAPDEVALTEQFNALGLEGWELVGAEGFYVMFKRPL